MPDWSAYVRSHLRLGRLDPHREAEIVEDVARQLEDVYRAARARGESDAEAREVVRLQVPDWEAFAAEVQRSSSRHQPSPIDRWHDASVARDGGAAARLPGLQRDLVQALRLLVKNPVFTAIAALTIALGVGANTTVFSIVNGVLRLPLPVSEIDRVVSIREQNLEQGIAPGPASLSTYADVRDGSTGLAAVMAARRVAYNFEADGEPLRIQGCEATSGFFEVVGVEPAVGRGFLPEDGVPGAAPVAVIADHFWRASLGADPGVVGSTVRLDGRPVTIVGIAPPGFWFPEKTTAVWTPLAEAKDETARADRRYSIMARLAPGAEMEPTLAEVRLVGERIARDRPDAHRGWSLHAVPVREHLVSQLSEVLTILYAAISLVLLIACANVANLLLARATDRGREIAVRSALGAGRWRLVRQLLIESVALALVGGTVGVLLALAGMEAIRAQIAGTNLALLVEGIRMDRYVLAHALGVSALAGVAFGVVPAWHTSRADLHALLKGGGRTAGDRRRHRLRGALVVAQVALALAMLAPTGLLVQLFAEEFGQDPGIDVDHLMSLHTDLTESRYPEWVDVADFGERSLQALEAVPGVTRASLTSGLPALAPAEPSLALEIESSPLEEAGPNAVELSVSPGHLETLGVDLVRGRGLSALDRADTPPVAVVSRAAVERFWPGRDGLGMRFRRAGSGAEWIEVVGVVEDVGAHVAGEPYVPHVYVPLAQRPTRELAFIVQTAGEPLAVLPAVRTALASVDSRQPFYEARAFSWLASRARATDVFLIGLLAILAGIALALALVGIYGVISYSVRQKTREIGIQMALGARAPTLLMKVMRQGLTLTGAGLALGMLLAVAIVRALEVGLGDLTGLTAASPPGLAAVGAFVVVTALLACYLPARRATTVDPAAVLRDE